MNATEKEQRGSWLRGHSSLTILQDRAEEFSK